ncbi:excitatory amino acid transporter-like [Pecten maximus]|uniref:excitatory amino acid transporter-like n=1 Tax=Pecten maximus TaxID=6579 RepID=UPI001458872C|nr:excitatory amino acid transporter-like [Pecten maximus]
MEVDDMCGSSEEEPIETKQNDNRSCLRRNLLLVLAAVGVAVGFCLGFGLRSADLSTDAIMWLALPGKMFMRMLMLTIIPLIASSIIIGTANADRKSSGRVGALALGFLVLSNVLGAILGIIVYFIFTPGNDMMYISTNNQVAVNSRHLQTQDMIADFIRNVVPDNIVSACFQKTQTRYIADPVLTNSTNATILSNTREVGVVNGINFLGVILISAVVGLAASTVEEANTSFIPFFRATSDIFIKIMQWFIWSTPVGVASLICVSIVQVESIEDTFRSLGMFILYYTIGILVQHFVLIPVVYFVIIRKNPFKFLLTAIRPWMATFGTASSALAMPEMINTCENMNKSDVKVCRFVLPLGVAMCRPGSVYFIVMSSLFITNLTGVEYSAADVLMIGLLTTVSSLSIPSVPSAAIVIIIIVLESINVDTTAVGLLLALEWYTDRIRGASNALHVVTCVMVVNKFCTSGSNNKKRERNVLLV